MSILTLLLFFIYTSGIGYSMTYFVKKPEKASERIVMQIGIGLGTIPIILVAMNVLHIQLDWRILLAISLAIPAYSAYKKHNWPGIPRLKITKSAIYFAIVMLLFILTFYMYHKGSFLYPWLENGDPWEYAVAVKYIATYKTYDPPKEIESLYKKELTENKFRYIANYLPPYPPGYVALMAVLHETNTSVNWTLKFFTSLIASLGILFFYFFAKELTKDSKIALMATFILAAIPAYLSHFTYSQSLAATLFIPALYCLEKTREDKNWLIPAGFCISGVLITQSSSAAVFAVLFAPAYFAVRLFTKQNWKAVMYAGVLGILLAGVFWGSMVYKYTWDGTRPTRDKPVYDARRGNPLDIYTLSDFVWAVNPKEGNMIDNPKGLGPAVFILALIGTFYFAVTIKDGLKPWLLITMLWLLLNTLNVNAERLPFGFNPHRGWSFFTFAVAIIAAYGATELAATLKKRNVEKIIVFGAVVIAVFFTSGLHKYYVNTSMWPTHYFSSQSDIPGYMWLENLPDNTRVTSLCRDDEKAIGMDMMSTKQWDPSQREFLKISLNKTAEEIYEFVKEKGYEYAIIDSSCVERFGINITNDRFQEMMGTGKFAVVYPTQPQDSSAFVIRVL
jgi:hypothetical protein